MGVDFYLKTNQPLKIPIEKPFLISENFPKLAACVLNIFNDIKI